jgi:nitrite reductase/ring-hydroxylating ferredoxin subunit
VGVVIMDAVRRFVEDLLRSRKPGAFRATDQDAGVTRTAITLRAARPGSGAPREEFVTGLHRRLAAELDPSPQRTGGRRRAFIGAAAVAAGAAAAGAGIDHVLSGPGAAPAPPQSADTLTPSSGTWWPVIAGADLPEGSVHSFDAGGISGFVERVDGHVRAVSGICTHQGCRLMLAARRAGFVCPCHGARFATDGTVTWHRPGITLTALPRLAVREADGVVQVYAPRPA